MIPNRDIVVSLCNLSLNQAPKPSRHRHVFRACRNANLLGRCFAKNDLESR